MHKAVYCIANSQAQAESIVKALRDQGFPADHISVLFPDQSGAMHFGHEQHTKAPEGASTGAGTGGLLGGALGWLAGAGVLSIPGLGPFIAAGPLLATLSGIGAGAALGGIAGALIGLGMPEYEAKRYEGKIKSGNILISVHAESQDEGEKAQRVFEQQDAEDIAMGREPIPSRKV